MSLRYKFDRMELSGSLGDLGTLLPLAIGMIMMNGINPAGVFFSIGLCYILCGIYFGIPIPIQPMKVIGAYAVATAMSASQILASGALMGLLLLIIGATGAITVLGKYIPKAVVRGVQFSTGTLLVVQGFRLIVGTSKYQLMREAAEPYLNIQMLGPIPIGVVIGLVGGILTLLLLENRKLPAGLFIILGGLLLGVILGTRDGLGQLEMRFHLPDVMPLGFPSSVDFTFAFFALVLPQTPMTIGNAVMAYADLSKEYFEGQAKRVTYRSACISMGLANFVSFLFGGMPLCHGAGGLAAHYRFGARTGGSNLMIGTLFLLLALFLGDQVLAVVNLLPMAILGVLLIFAGSQLTLTISDMRERKDLFVIIVMLGITLASNLAYGFIVGLTASYLLKWKKLNI